MKKAIRSSATTNGRYLTWCSHYFRKMKYAAAGLTLMALSAPTDVMAAAPTLDPINNVTLPGGSPLHIPLDGFDPEEAPLTYTVESSNVDISTFILEGNRSMRITVPGHGDMVFELFESRVPRVTDRIVELAEAGFYDGVIFHRVMDAFMIQGGDPTGTGSGGSGTAFDDQFHVDLQHNLSGVLSMAKSYDDTNDSQFFITEVPTRGLDFNHSIFGQLVEGEAVRESISNVATDDATDRPFVDVVMESVEIFFDAENAVLMLKAPEGASGLADVTVTCTDDEGLSAQQAFQVSMVTDTVNSNPFLADIPPVSTVVDTPVQFQLTAIDVEEDPVLFGEGDSSNPDLLFEVSATGLVTVTPTNGLSGDHWVVLGTCADDGQWKWDAQAVPVTVVPEPAALALQLAAVAALVWLRRRA